MNTEELQFICPSKLGKLVDAAAAAATATAIDNDEEMSGGECKPYPLRALFFFFRILCLAPANNPISQFLASMSLFIAFCGVPFCRIQFNTLDYAIYI